LIDTTFYNIHVYCNSPIPDMCMVYENGKVGCESKLKSFCMTHVTTTAFLDGQRVMLHANFRRRKSMLSSDERRCAMCSLWWLAGQRAPVNGRFDDAGGGDVFEIAAHIRLLVVCFHPL